MTFCSGLRKVEIVKQIRQAVSDGKTVYVKITIADKQEGKEMRWKEIPEFLDVTNLIKDNSYRNSLREQTQENK